MGCAPDIAGINSNMYETHETAMAATAAQVGIVLVVFMPSSPTRQPYFHAANLPLGVGHAKRPLPHTNPILFENGTCFRHAER